MKTFTTYKSLFQANTQNYTTEALNFGIFALNDSARTIANINKGTWRWLEDTDSILSVAGQRTYQVPNRFRKVVTVYVQVAALPTSVIWIPTPIFDPSRYELLLQARLGQSDVARYVYIKGTEISFVPIPDTTGSEIHFRGRLKVKDISTDDYTTGTITALTTGSKVVTLSGATINTSRNGDWILIKENLTDKSGDEAWYQIDTVDNTNQITLVKPYQGPTVTAAAITFIIGQAYPIPEAYDTAVLYRALALYWTKQKDMALAKTYWMLYDGGNEAGLSDEVGGIVGQMFIEEGETFEGPYISPDDNFRFDPNNPQPDAPQSSF